MQRASTLEHSSFNIGRKYLGSELSINTMYDLYIAQCKENNDLLLVVTVTDALLAASLIWGFLPRKLTLAKLAVQQK